MFPSYSRERMTTAALCSGTSEEGALALSLLSCMSVQPHCFCPFPPDGSELTSFSWAQTFLPRPSCRRGDTDTARVLS